MKKILFMMSALALMFTSCDPSKDSEGPDSNVSADELTAGFTIKAKSEGNNNLIVSASPARYIWVYNAEDGSVLGQGTNVEIQEVPPVGERTYFIETMNQDGTKVRSAVKSITVTEFTDLPAIFETLYGDGTGNYKPSTWTWDTEAPGGQYWGNGGYQADGFAAWENDTPGKWWGPGNADEWAGAVKDHSDYGTSIGEEVAGAYMTLSPQGQLTKYKADGTLLNTGSVKVNAKTANEYKMANLITSPGAILFPFEINSNGKKPTSFDITFVSKQKMALTYPDGGAQGQWGEATFWRFKAKK